MISAVKEKRPRKSSVTAVLEENVGFATEQLVKIKREVVTRRDWDRYLRDQDPEIRQRLLNRYLPLVRNVAGRMAINFPR